MGGGFLPVLYSKCYALVLALALVCLFVSDLDVF